MAVDPQTILGWLRRLIALDTSVFDEIKGNPTSTIPAVAVVSISIFLSGVGGWLWWMVQDYPDASDILVKSVLLGSAPRDRRRGTSPGSVLVYLILTQFLRERCSWSSSCA